MLSILIINTDHYLPNVKTNQCESSHAFQTTLSGQTTSFNRKGGLLGPKQTYPQCLSLNSRLPSDESQLHEVSTTIDLEAVTHPQQQAEAPGGSSVKQKWKLSGCWWFHLEAHGQERRLIVLYLCWKGMKHHFSDSGRVTNFHYKETPKIYTG